MTMVSEETWELLAQAKNIGRNVGHVNNVGSTNNPPCRLQRAGGKAIAITGVVDEVDTVVQTVNGYLMTPCHFAAPCRAYMQGRRIGQAVDGFGGNGVFAVDTGKQALGYR